LAAAGTFTVDGLVTDAFVTDYELDVEASKLPTRITTPGRGAQGGRAAAQMRRLRLTQPERRRRSGPSPISCRCR
jgi:hypothetical protein